MKSAHFQVTRLLVLGTLFTVMPGITRAEDWVTVAGDPAEARLEIDQDSISQVSDTSFTAAWRLASARDGFKAISNGTIDCANEVLRLPKPDVRGSNRVYPAGRAFLGAVVWHVCGRLSEYRSARERQIAAARARAECDSKSAEVAPELCANSEDAKEALRILYLRIGQVQLACNLSKGQAESIALGIFSDVRVCRVSTPNCGVGLVTQHAEGLGGDLGRVELGQRCSYTPWIVAKAAEALESDESVKRFQRCADLAVSKLDDRVSPADVVADGVFGACRDELVPMLASSAVFASTVRPKIIANILLHRQKFRQRPPVKPAGPPAPPPTRI